MTDSALGARSFGLSQGRSLLLGFLTTAVSLVFASGAMASGPLIVGNNAAFGGGPIQTYDFSAGGSPVASFVPTGASDSNNGRGVEVIGSEVFYTELGGGGPTNAIEVAPYHGGAGGSDTRTLLNPRPGVGIQDLSASGGSLYVLTGYFFSSPPQVFKLDPSSGAVLAGPIDIAAPASPASDGFAVLPNGNFLINNGDAICTYNQYNGSTGALVSGTAIAVQGANACTGVDTDGTSLFFATDFSGFTQTDLSGQLVAKKTVTSNAVEDISIIRDNDLALTGVPLDKTVDATSRAGAVVRYTLPTAVDPDDNPVTATVSCNPASGSTFAIGMTKVACTATDADDSNSPASASFNVTVRGAAAQLADLCAASKGVGPGQSLANKCAAAQAALAAGNASDASSILNAYINEVKAQTGKKIDAATASGLIAAAQQIMAVIGP